MIVARLLGGGQTLRLDVTTRCSVFATLGYPSMNGMAFPSNLNPFLGEAAQ